MRSRRSHYDLDTAVCHNCHNPNNGNHKGIGPVRVRVGFTHYQMCSMDCARLAVQRHIDRICPCQITDLP
jgi:hypothetical protein